MEHDPSAPAPIKVVDRRRFTATGDVRPDAGPLSDTPRKTQPLIGRDGRGQASGAGGRQSAQPRESAEPRQAGQRQVPPQQAGGRPPQAPGQHPGQYPDEAFAEELEAGPGAEMDEETAAAFAGQRRLDFLPFIASLATNAMAALGMLPDAERQGIPRNPAMAREYIDIIAMLEEKTRGNLTAEEAQTMTRLLGDLRMQYVELTRSVQRATVAPPPPPHLR